MPKYIAKRKTWLSHECRSVEAGKEFETVFPTGVELSDNIQLVKNKTKPKANTKPEAENAPVNDLV